MQVCVGDGAVGLTGACRSETGPRSQSLTLELPVCRGCPGDGVTCFPAPRVSSAHCWDKAVVTSTVQVGKWTHREVRRLSKVAHTQPAGHSPRGEKARRSGSRGSS